MKPTERWVQSQQQAPKKTILGPQAQSPIDQAKRRLDTSLSFTSAAPSHAARAAVPTHFGSAFTTWEESNKLIEEWESFGTTRHEGVVLEPGWELDETERRWARIVELEA